MGKITKTKCSFLDKIKEIGNILVNWSMKKIQDPGVGEPVTPDLRRGERVEASWATQWVFIKNQWLQKVPKELKGSATLQEEQHYELTSTLELMSLAAYVAEDGLVSHHWDERPLGLSKIISPSTGECQGQEAGVGG